MKRGCSYSDTESLIIFRSKLSEKLLNSGYTCGYQWDRDEESANRNSPYSKELRALINECLLVESTERPSLETLVERTKAGTEGSRLAQQNIIRDQKDEDGAPLPYQEPQLSAQWYSVNSLHDSYGMANSRTNINP
jgi:hypothetical protein